MKITFLAFLLTAILVPLIPVVYREKTNEAALTDKIICSQGFINLHNILKKHSQQIMQQYERRYKLPDNHLYENFKRAYRNLYLDSIQQIDSITPTEPVKPDLKKFLKEEKVAWNEFNHEFPALKLLTPEARKKVIIKSFYAMRLKNKDVSY